MHNPLCLCVPFDFQCKIQGKIRLMRILISKSCDQRACRPTVPVYMESLFIEIADFKREGTRSKSKRYWWQNHQKSTSDWLLWKGKLSLDFSKVFIRKSFLNIFTFSIWPFIHYKCYILDVICRIWNVICKYEYS